MYSVCIWCHNQKILSILEGRPVLQLDSEKCTGRYFKVRDDDLSSKQGSISTFRMILIKLLDKSNITRHPNLKAPVHFSELSCWYA